MICFQDSFLLEVVLAAWSWEVLSALNFPWRQWGPRTWHLGWGPLPFPVTIPAAPMTSRHLQELACALHPSYLPLNVGALCLRLQALPYHDRRVLQMLFICGSSKCYLSVAPIKIQRVYHVWHLNAFAGLAAASHGQAIACAIRAVHLVHQGHEMDFLRCLYRLLK